MRRNKSLALVAGSVDTCAVGEEATLISQNFYWSPRKTPFPCSAPVSTSREINAEAGEAGSICPLASRYIARVKIPLSDLANPSRLMPLVILSNENGDRIHSWENVRNHATQSGIRYRSAAALLQQVKLKQRGTGTSANANDIDEIGYSDFVDLDLAGERYRAYVMPWQKIPFFTEDCEPDDCEQTVAGSSNYYLIGLQPYASLLGSKLSISHSIVVMLVLAVLLLIGLLPVVKLQLVSPQQAFTSADRKALIFGAMLFMALLVLGSYHYILYNGFRDQLDAQASNIHQQISTRFKTEIMTWRRLAEMTWSHSGLADNVGDAERPGLAGECVSSPDFLLPPEVFVENSFIEGTFILGQDGKFEVGRWSHRRHCRPNASTNLTHRSYYRQGMDCTGWRIGDAEDRATTSECRGKYHIERVLNVRDSRLNTWLSLPLFDTPYLAGASDGEDRKLLVFGGRLQTFIRPVLPLHFSYLVFDNDTGIVQYHSEDQASSLVDNIFVDTVNNNYLNSLIRLNPTTPQTFSGLYKGREYLFSAGRITQAIPWTLLVMYEKAPFRNINMLSALSALLITVGLIGLAWVLCLLLPGNWRRGLFRPLMFDRTRRSRDYFVSASLLLLLLCFALTVFFSWYHPGILLLGMLTLLLPLLVVLCSRRVRRRSDETLPPQIIEPEQRKSTAYTLYILMLLFNTVAVPSLIVSEQSHRFFLDQHVALMSFDITRKIEEATRERRHYVDSFIDSREEGLQSARKLQQKSDRVRCHLGDKQDPEGGGLYPDCGSGEFTSTAFNYTQDNVRMVSGIAGSMHGEGFVQKLWQQLNLKLEATSDFEVLAQTPALNGSAAGATPAFYRFNPSVSKLYRAIWNDQPVRVLVAVLLIALLPYWLLRMRVLANLFGLQFTKNYQSQAPVRALVSEPGDACDDSRDVASALRRMLTHYRKSDAEPVNVQLIRPGVQTRALFSGGKPGHSEGRAASGPVPASGDGDGKITLLTPDPVDLNVLAADASSSPQDVLETLLTEIPPHGYPTLALRGLEHIPLDPVKRRNALRLLQYLVSQRTVNLILLADVSPLYRFTRLDAYPYNVKPENLPDSDEQIAWAALFRRFIKIYDWVPEVRTGQPGNSAWWTLLRECEGWSELQRIAREFLAYHCARKDPGCSLELALKNLQLASDSSDSNPVESRSRCSSLADSIDRHWTPAQVIEFFGVAAVAHYRYRWELCTTQERLLLIQLAHDNTPNPRNTVPIEHLLRRGYLYPHEGWRLANDSFRCFVLHAEDPATVLRWIGDANESMWKYVKIPIFILLLSLLGLLAYSAAEAFHSFLGIAAAILGLVPLLLRNISLIRNQSSTDN